MDLSAKISKQVQGDLLLDDLFSNYTGNNPKTDGLFDIFEIETIQTIPTHVVSQYSDEAIANVVSQKLFPKFMEFSVDHVFTAFGGNFLPYLITLDAKHTHNFFLTISNTVPSKLYGSPNGPEHTRWILMPDIINRLVHDKPSKSQFTATDIIGIGLPDLAPVFSKSAPRLGNCFPLRVGSPAGIKTGIQVVTTVTDEVVDGIPSKCIAVTMFLAMEIDPNNKGMMFWARVPWEDLMLMGVVNETDLYPTLSSAWRL